MRIVSQLDAEGYYAGTTIADESPLEPGVFLIPAGAVAATAPDVPEGKRARWDDGWALEDIPAPPAPPQIAPPTHEELTTIILRQARAERAPILSVLDGLQTSALVKGDMGKAQQIEVAKQGLRDITALDLSGYTTHEEMRLAIKARYVQLVASAPEDVRLAFKQVAG